MTRSLTAAIEKLEALSPEEQDRVASWLLDELTDEARWAEQFAASQDLLLDLANEAITDHAQGRGEAQGTLITARPGPAPALPQ
jgi:hypothetical protein